MEFLPRSAVLDNVVAQIKAETLAYSLFFLSRSFLEKPQRYEVSLKASSESPLYRLGDTGSVSTDRGFLESNAFRLASDRFYRVEVTQSEPLKGNFTSILWHNRDTTLSCYDCRNPNANPYFTRTYVATAENE